MTAGLVLAAGESSRMGRDKALLAYQGCTFLETVIAKLQEGGVDRVAVVLGHHAQAIRQAVNLAGVEVVTNCDYLRGQTSSLQAGLAALTGPPAGGETLDAIVLCLVDHPVFEPATVSALVAAFDRRQAPVIIPTHHGRRGHPVLIARPLFEPLLALSPHQGANSVIRAWRDQTEFLEVADPGVLIDVDDPEAYGRLR